MQITYQDFKIMLQIFSLKLRDFWLYKNAVYSINEGIPQDDKYSTKTFSDSEGI